MTENHDIIFSLESLVVHFFDFKDVIYLSGDFLEISTICL